MNTTTTNLEELALPAGLELVTCSLDTLRHGNVQLVLHCPHILICSLALTLKVDQNETVIILKTYFIDKMNAAFLKTDTIMLPW